MTHQRDSVSSICELDLSDLDRTRGGIGTSQQELRAMAQKYCPKTFAQNRSAAQITRPMAERCLDEAGYGLFKGQLDRYFPKK